MIAMPPPLRMLTESRRCAIIGILGMLWLAATPERSCAMLDDGETFFENRIRPILVERCYECHGVKKQEGGLRLDSKSGWQSGGDRGPAIQPGDSDHSLVVQAIRYEDADLQMPPTRKLSEREVADIEAWVAMGASDPRDHTPTVANKTGPGLAADLWSLKPIRDVRPPALDKDTTHGNPIDGFIEQGYRAVGLSKSPRADRRTLLRRAFLDLTGLLPSIEEVEAFERDPRDDAYEQWIEQLLASPQYGEHWARHWLDVARYSDTKGYVYAREEKRWVHASTYRDWVVRAINDDMPYDQFVRLQIAADQIAAPDSPDLAAMGYLTIGRRFLGVTHDIIDDRIDAMTRGMLGLTVACARCHDHKFDPISTRDYYSLYGVFQSSSESVVTLQPPTNETAFKELGEREAKLRDTMAKYREEQSTRVRGRIEHYLLAQLELDKYPDEVFNQVIEADDLNPIVVRKWQSFLLSDQQSDAPLLARWHELVRDHAAAELRTEAARYAERFAEVDARWKALLAVDSQAARMPSEQDERMRQVLYGIDGPCYVPDEHIANNEMFFPTNQIEELWKLQGEVDRYRLDKTQNARYATVLTDRQLPSTPRVLIRGNPTNKGAEVPRRFLESLGGEDQHPFQTGSGRLELANAIASPSNPLTARVMVNRIWMHHFGRGLVNTPSDFGYRAEPPSHPELLDWLAGRFIQSGWSLKQMHRQMMLSETYQQSSLASPDQETLRATLDPANRWLSHSNSHRLSFEEARDGWLMATNNLSWNIGGKPLPLFAEENARRTLYAFIDREQLVPTMRLFDFANPDLSIAQRNETTVPQQALFAMNHPFIAEQAALLVQRLESPEPTQRIRELYRTLFQRGPTKDEIELAVAFVQEAPAEPESLQRFKEWSYGYGRMDTDAGHLVDFNPLPYFQGSAWQGGRRYPDRKLGWLQLTATGGHPGNDLKHAVVRRWTAPQDGMFHLASTIQHEPEVGDGIRAFVVHSALGLLRSATVHHATEKLDLDSIEVKQGDTIDFVVDIREGLNSDQFLWAPTLTLAAHSAPAGSGEPPVWNAESNFANNERRLKPWEQLVQVLMLSNEFMFVD